jgi:hypothetical protein
MARTIWAEAARFIIVVCPFFGAIGGMARISERVVGIYNRTQEVV